MHHRYMGFARVFFFAWPALIGMPLLGFPQTTCTCGPSGCTLGNALCSYTITRDATTNEVWLGTGYLNPLRPVSFLRAPLWEVAIRYPDGTLSYVQPQQQIPPTGLQLPLTTPPACNTNPALPNPVIFMTWWGSVTPPNTTFPVDLTVNVIFGLGHTSTYLNAVIGVEITNPSPAPPADGAGVTAYRLWNIKFPRVEIPILDPAAHEPSEIDPIGGSDVLATGRYGGLLYLNPIKWREIQDWPEGIFGSAPLQLSGEEDRLTGLIDAGSADPGTFNVPFVYYYNPQYDASGPLGVYISHNDDVGLVKGIILKQYPAKVIPGVMTYTGSLLYELVHYPSDQPETPQHEEIFDIAKYKPYQPLYPDFNFFSQIAIVHGDWGDAAKKYRDYRLNNPDGKFAYLQGPGVQRPSGHPDNTNIPSALKTNPIQVRIVPACQASDYCVGILDVGVADGIYGAGDSPVQLAGMFDWVHSQFGTPPIPYLMFERVQVAADEVRFDGGVGTYVPSLETVMGIPVMDKVRGLCLAASSRQHLVLLDSMTEKFWHSDHADICELWACCPGYDSSLNGLMDFCCSIDPDWRRLTWDCSTIHDADDPTLASGRVCPAGKSDIRLGNPPSYSPDTKEARCPEVDSLLCPLQCPPPPMSTSTGDPVADAFENVVSQAIMQMQLTGGMRFNTPCAGANYCLARYPLHDHYAGFGHWALDAWRLIATGIRAKAARPDSFFLTVEAGNTTISDFVRVQNPVSLDVNHDAQNFVPNSNKYFDAPIRSIPLMQMVADEIRYCTNYRTNSLSLPYTKNFLKDRNYFEKFPAVTAALSCYAQAKRALAYQSSVVIDTGKADLTLWDLPLITPEQQAARGMLDFYLGLRSFLTAPGTGSRNNMGYFTGSMERRPTLAIAGELFKIEGADIHHASNPFPDLVRSLDQAATFGIPYPGLQDDFYYDRYRPVHEKFFEHGICEKFVWPVIPDEAESWLPHGMYRHWDKDESPVRKNLALLIANPWGVMHQDGAGSLIPMNPFTFDFVNPLSSPATNTYSYSCTFDPSKYRVTGAYTVTRKTWDVSGNLFQSSSPLLIPPGQTYSDTRSLSQFRFRAYYFDEQ